MQLFFFLFKFEYIFVNTYQDEEPVKNSARMKVIGNQLSIRHIQHQDVGMYSCNFVNPLGAVSHIVKVVIRGQ